MKKLINIYNDSLIKNSIYLMAANFFSLALGFFFWVIIANYYTPGDVGIMSSILLSSSLISMISMVGFSRTLIFYLPRNAKNANRIINSCLIVIIIISVILSLIFISGLDIWTPELKTTLSDLKYILLFTVVTVMTSISALLTAAYIAGKKSSFHMTKETLFSFIKMLPITLLAGLGAMGILVSWTIGLALATVAGFILLSRIWRYSPAFTFDPIVKSMINFSAGNHIGDIFYTIPKMILPVIVLNLTSADQAGYFFIALTIANILYGVPLSISNSLLAESSDEDRFQNSVSKAVRFNVLLISIGILLCITLGKFVLNIFNPVYAENSVTSLIILTMACIPISLINIFNTVRNYQNKVASVVKVNVSTALITLVISVFFIKAIGPEGAAISYLIANTVVAMVIFFKMRNPVEYTLRLLKGDSNVVSV